MNVHDSSTKVPPQFVGVQFKPAKLLRVVNSLIKHRQPVTLPTLARWRKHWGSKGSFFDYEDAVLFAYYGDLIYLGFSPDQAKQMTINFFKGERNVECVEKSQATTARATI